MLVTANPNDMLDTNAAAQVLGLKPGTLAVWRADGRAKKLGLTHIKMGAAVRYRRRDLEDFLARRTVNAPAAGAVVQH
jgi:hypothetical protein